MNILSVPVQNNEVTYIREGDEGILFHCQKGKVRTINYVGDLVWNLIDGKSSIAEIIKIVEKEFDHQVASVKSDVITFLKELNHRSLIYLKEE